MTAHPGPPASPSIVGRAGSPATAVVKEIVINAPLDSYLSLKALSAYSGLSRRTLQGFLNDPVSPLPCYRPGGKKVLVRRSEFDAWMERFRHRGRADVAALADEVVRSFQ